MIYLLCAIGVIIMAFFVYAMCRVAGVADDAMERMMAEMEKRT